MNEDKVVQLLLEHGEAIRKLQENVTELLPLTANMQSVMGTLDTLVGLAQKKDQELTIATHDMIKLEKRVDTHDRQIGKLAVAAGVAL